MEHGASERVKERSHTVIPVKTEVDKAAKSTAYCEIQVNMNYAEEEPGLVELVKSEAALLVKEEVVGDGRQDVVELHCKPSTSTIVGSMNELEGIGDPGNILNVKEELGAIDIGPTVLQHMDTWYTTNQKDVGVVKQEHTINHKNLNPILCGGVKEEIIEDEWRGSPTPQDSLMEQTGTCTALHSLHKECLETVCRVELRRLDTFQCEVCDAVYIDAHKLRQHVQDVHGPGPKRSLDRHVKSPQISNGPQQCATADTEDQRSDKAGQSKQRARPQLYSCDKCVKTYTSKESLVQHYRNLHSTESHKCNKCNKKFPSKQYLYMHTSSVHSEKQYECAVCKIICRSKPSLYMHVYRVHRPRPAADTEDQRSDKAGQSKQRARPQLYSCDKCVKTYTSKESLVQHYRNLHSTESHKCNKCNKKFPSKQYLYMHTSSVHSEKQYECAVCKKICRSKPSLYMHVYRVHRPRPAADTDDQRGKEAVQSKQRAQTQSYSCYKCGKTYTEKKYLWEHNKNLHSTESHKCTKCNKKFPSKSYLRVHTSNAHSEQQYECAVCKKIYKSKAALSVHVYKVHRPRPAADMDDQRGNEAVQSKQRAQTQSYSCDKCGKTYTEKKYLWEHNKNLHSTESHKCTKCNKKFPSKSYLRVHTSNAHSEQQYECAVCKKIYKSKAALSVHVYKVHRLSPAADMDDQRGNEAVQSKQRAQTQSYSCDKCGKTYTEKKYLWEHNKNLHSTESHKCTKCNKKFPSKSYLRVHTSNAHSEQQYECAVCKKIYKSKAALSVHVYKVHRLSPAADMDDQRSDKESQSKQRARSQLYSCDECAKTYACKDSLLAHYRNQHSTESHECTKCNKKFPSKYYLYQHTKNAHSEQQYECAVCKKVCKSKAALNVHVHQVHRSRPAVSSPVVYTCDYCHKTYSTKRGLVQHIDVHTKAHYRCSECNKKYTGKLYLQAHIRRVHSKEEHEGLQIHTCEYCQKTFRYKSGLWQHTKNIHVAAHIHRCRRCDMNFKSNEVLQRHNTCIHAQYKCQVCLKFYKTIYTLRRHFKKAHNSKDIQFKSDLLPHAMPDLRLTADVTDAAASTSIQQHNVDVVKEEPADAELELGPVVFQHMDCNYRPYKQEPQDGLGD